MGEGELLIGWVHGARPVQTGSPRQQGLGGLPTPAVNMLYYTRSIRLLLENYKIQRKGGKKSVLPRVILIT